MTPGSAYYYLRENSFLTASILALMGITTFAPNTSSEETALELKQVITLQETRAPSSKPFHATVTLPADKSLERIEVTFCAGPNRLQSRASVLPEQQVEGNQVAYGLRAQVPEYKSLFNGVQPMWYEGWWAARRAELTILLDLEDEQIRRTFEFAVPLRTTGTLWGVAVLIFLMVIGALTKPDLFSRDARLENDQRVKLWKEKHPLVKGLLFPLNFTITPIGTYSISMFQVLFWTCVVIFASVYVFVVRGEFLNVTEQILILLGISGGTALGAKVNAVVRERDIPKEYFTGITRNRLPHLRNLVCIGGVPSIFKFQILAFTLINGLIVIRQLYANFDFPPIPEGQLTLMGISGAIYLGNEVGMENIWDKLMKMIEAAEKIKGAGKQKREEMKADVKKELKSIYESI